tara:strand:- start:1413 stop:2444 length:1032 start_codon:yes stop_codon:yes gene_type:complete
LLDQGHQIKLFVYNFGKIENYRYIKPRLIRENFFTKFINNFFKIKQNKFYLPSLKEFKKEIIDTSPDVVIMRPYSKLFTLLILISNFISDFKTILYHQTDFEKLGKFNFSTKYFKFFLISKIFKMRSYSPLFNNRKKLPFKELYFLPFAKQINLKKKKYNTKNNFLMIGKFIKKKNHEMFIRGIKYLTTKYEVKATIIGEVSTREHKIELDRIKKLINRLNLKNIIKIKTNIKNNKIMNYYYRNDFFVLPTTHDPAPISIIEALSMGCMVLCSSSCGTKNYIKVKLNGFIFKNNDQKSLNQCLIKLIKNKKFFFKNFNQNKKYLLKTIGNNNFNKHFYKLIKY